jgi:hypothetical protein
MCKQIRYVLVVSALLLCSGWHAHAETPQLISYQGFLTDSAGPASGVYTMVFNIYETEAGGTPLWSSGPVDIEVVDGYFHYMLGVDGALSGICFEGADRWLGVQVLPDNEMTPLARLGSVPYSYKTSRADTADVGGGWVVAAQGKARGPVITPSDPSAYIALGTSDPFAKLHVTGALPGEDLLRAGDSTLVVPGEGSVLVGTRLCIQHIDIGLLADYQDVCDDDIIVEDTNAVIGLYSSSSGSYAGGIVFGQVSNGSMVDKWAMLRETPAADYGGNGLRFTYGPQCEHATNSTFMRMASDGDIAIGTEDPEGYRLLVESSGEGASGATGMFRNTSSGLGIAMIGESHGTDVTMLLSQEGSGPILRCDSWTDGWHPVFTVENNGRTKVRGVLEVQTIDGTTLIEMGEGLDYAEGFDVSDGDAIEPGNVLVIDPKNPGKLTLSARPYDRAVAGVAAGAGGLGSGVRLGARQFDSDVALAGRVFCNVDASFGEIQPGDLLTTSPTPGYAMKVADYERAQGAILGKAMEPMEQGRKGQILVLVTLQ